VVQAWLKLAREEEEERKKKEAIKMNQEEIVDLLRAAQITCVIEKRISAALGYAREEDPIPKNGIDVKNIDGNARCKIRALRISITSVRARTSRAQRETCE
jgi:uncharacterized protein YhfF